MYHKLTNDILNLDRNIATTHSPDLLKQRMLLQAEFNLLSSKYIVNLINKSHHTIYEHSEKTCTADTFRLL